MTAAWRGAASCADRRTGTGPPRPAGGVMDTMQKPATATIRAQHDQLTTSLPMHDEQDFADARRGFLAALEPGVVRSDGRVVWDSASYGFLGGDAPATVNPSLW